MKKQLCTFVLSAAIALSASLGMVHVSADTASSTASTTSESTSSQSALRQTTLADGTLVLDAFKVGSSATFTETADDGAGDYAITVNYINGTSYTRHLNLYVNETKETTLTLEPSASSATVRSVTVSVPLQAGDNTVMIRYDKENFDPATCPPSDMEGAATASTVAASITSVQEPRQNATSFLLPVVPDGMTVAIASSSNPDVISTDGTLHFTSAAQTTDLVFSVTDLDGNKADTQSFTVTVPAKAGYADSLNSTGPMYWIGYENPFQDDAFLKEDRWDSNVKWMADNFVKYGYNMMSTDGWIEGGQDIDDHGYITKYNASWTKGWKEMADQLKQNGMKLGVYYDPLWMTAAAYNSDDLIEGTDIPVKSLINTDYGYFSTFKAQDVPSTEYGSQFSNTDVYAAGKVALYWIDTDKPGAEQWIKGYVKHFAEAGAVFLRSDFLGWYENGISGDGKQNGLPAYGTERYEKALQWIREACDEYGIEFSLVMPNQYNNAENEVKYGDMMRVDEDVANGGWDNDTQINGWPQNHISGRRRGQWQPDWAQWGNVFDALTGWADVGGRGQITLDADFLRMDRFDKDDSLDTTKDNTKLLDARKRSTVSLFVMGGSPLAIADQYDTINDGNTTGIDNKTYYENTELLSLHQQGFIAKPMGLGQSERWAGQLPDGSWVVGLFNRDETSKTQTVDFLKDLGITGTASVHDMWKHTDLGSMTSYSVTLGPCDSVVLKITPSTVRYQAETASLRSGAHLNVNHSGFSGIGFVDKLENGKGDVLTAMQTTAGTQNLLIRYCNGSTTDATAELSLNGETVQTVDLPGTGSWDTWKTISVPVDFTGGVDIVDLADTSTNGFNLDYFELNQAGAASTKQYYQVAADTSAIGSGAKVASDHQLSSDGNFVAGLDSPWWGGSNDTVAFTVNVPAAGAYDLIFRYANGTSADATANVEVNGTKVGYYTLPVVYAGAWDTWGKVTVSEQNDGSSGLIQLKAGENTITYKQGTSAVNLDTLTVVPHASSETQTAQQIADSITSLVSPVSGDTRILMPKADGFDIAVANSDPAGIIDSEGNITTPDEDTVVELTFSVTNLSDLTDTAVTQTLAVTVPGTKDNGSGSSSSSNSSSSSSSPSSSNSSSSSSSPNSPSSSNSSSNSSNSSSSSNPSSPSSSSNSSSSSSPSGSGSEIITNGFTETPILTVGGGQAVSVLVQADQLSALPAKGNVRIVLDGAVIQIPVQSLRKLLADNKTDSIRFLLKLLDASSLADAGNSAVAGVQLIMQDSKGKAVAVDSFGSNVQVKWTIPSDYASKIALDRARLYHVADSGKTQRYAASFAKNAGGSVTVVFLTNHFSEYVVSNGALVVSGTSSTVANALTGHASEIFYILFTCIGLFGISAIAVRKRLTGRRK